MRTKAQEAMLAALHDIAMEKRYNTSLLRTNSAKAFFMKALWQEERCDRDMEEFLDPSQFCGVYLWQYVWEEEQRWYNRD